MLNDRRVPRDVLPTKRFRPAPVVLRPRTADPKNPSAKRARPTEATRSLGWLRPLVVTLLVTVLATTTLLSTDAGDRFTGLAASVQGVAAGGAVEAHRAWRRHLQTASVEYALHDLERQNARLRMEVLDLRAMDAERRALAHLLQMKGGWGLEGVGARVISEGGGGRATLRLDAGSERGVEPGLPVVHARGIVGQIIASGSGWSDVLCVTDPSHGLAGAIEEGPRGVLRGTRDGLAMDQVLSRYDVHAGAAITSTGAGGVFPPGFPIGTVARVTPDPGTPFWSIEVTPAAPPALMDEVLVVTGRFERPEVAFR